MHTIKLGRLIGLGCVWTILMLSLSVRLVYLHLWEDQFLKAKGDALTQRSILLAPHRGMILDRNGQALAVSTPVKSIFLNATQVDTTDKNWVKLAQFLNLSKPQLMSKIKKHPHTSFLYLKRHIDPTLSEKILNLHLAGVYAQTEYRRFYPMGEIFSQVVGHTGIDHIGQEGIELAYNTQLQGQPGTHRVLKDRSGLAVESLSKRQQPKQGKDVILSLDTRIQYLAYKELLKACQQYRAKSGSVVVLDVDTFEVLAMVNFPAYNPNFTNKAQDVRNRAVTDQFEPGSVMKPFSMVHILSQSDYTPETVIDTTPGTMMIERKVVKDLRNNGIMDLTQVIQKSSNVGIAQLMLGLPFDHVDHFYKLLEDIGLGSISDSGFPGERSGRILEEGKKHSFALATLAFGYGVALTPLQLAQSYAVLASGGIKRPVGLIKRDSLDEVTKEPEILDEKIIQSIKLVNKMLSTTSEVGGTASRARVPGYSVAGKTGTVRKLMNSGPNYEYSGDKHLAIFAGFAPVSHPKLAMAVIIDEPEVKYYGGEVSAPVFSKVMEGALRILAVPRDKVL